MQKVDKFFTKIGIRVFDKQRNFKEQWVTRDFMVSTYLVVMSSGKDLLVAYEQKKDMKDNSAIIVKRFSDFR